MDVRKRYIDILRFISAVGVVFIHVSANNWYGYIGSTNWIAFTIYEGLFKISVPLFFMISGSLFLNGEKERTIKTLYTRNIGRMVVFILFWAVVYKLIQYCGTGSSFIYTLQHTVKDIVHADVQVHLWFAYAIIMMYALVPLCRPLVKNSQREHLLYVIMLCFFMENICEFAGCLQLLSPITYIFQKIKSGISFGYLGYFLLGAYLDRYDIKEKFRNLIYTLGIVGMIVTISLVMWDCMSSSSLRERFWNYNMPGIYLASMAVFIFIKNLNLKENRLYKILRGVSERSLGIYGVHFVFIIIFWENGFSTFTFPGVISVPVISIIVLLLSYFTAQLLHMIPKLGKYIA